MRFLAVVLLGVSLSSSFAAEKSVRPNVIFVLADDLGYGDVRALNTRSRIPTPSLDRLAAEGMVFTDAHSGSAVCTPTRYGVVTGRYCWRTRLKSGVLDGYSPHLIDPARFTIADLMTQAGYRTACIGKWHLGMDLPREADDPRRVDYSAPIENAPTAYGFEYFYGIPASLDFTPYVYIENDRFTEPAKEHCVGGAFPAFLRAGETAASFRHIETLDHLAAKATSYIAAHAKSDQPFFLYFALTAPHKPVMPTPPFQGRSGLGPYGDFIMQTDSVIGQVDNALQQAGIADNTLIIVASDNGSYMYRLDEVQPRQTADGDHVTTPTIQAYDQRNHRANYLFRGTKADIWEGGHHVPFIARWPGKVKAGSQTGRTICLTDLMATCAEIVGTRLPDGAAEDSYSFLPLLVGKESDFRRAPVVHHSANGTFAIRDGRWKLILGSGSGGRGSPRSEPGSKPYQLYDMQADVAETANRMDDHPAIAARLEAAIQKLMDGGGHRADPR